MNNINTAIDMVMRSIPEPILKQTFITLQSHKTRIPVTLSTCIAEQIIYKKVLPDMNIVGGTTVVIPLDQCIVKHQDVNFTIYHIPKSVTDNRKIVNVLEMMVNGYLQPSVSGLTNHVSEIGLATTQSLLAMKTLPYRSEGRVNLIGDNTVMVEVPYHMAMNNSIRCMLEYDTGLTEISPRASLDFAKLVVLCTKAHIYNANVVEMDMGYIKGGAQLGIYKDIIDGYSDALDEYYEELKTRWSKIAKLDDNETRKRLITLMVGRVM